MAESREQSGEASKEGPFVITVDGPAASGKSSVSRLLAQSYGWSWLSTGAFYRALALVARKTGTALDQEEALVRLAESPSWRVAMAPERTLVFFKETPEGPEEDVTDQIYAEEVGSDASQISRFPGVRKSLLQAQRNCTQGVSGLVAEGRDCGTVIFPQAHLKIYLTAASESRAQRRAQEQGRDVEETARAQRLRDHQDSSRKAAPLTVPPGAHVIDTSQLNLDQVVEKVKDLLQTQVFEA